MNYVVPILTEISQIFGRLRDRLNTIHTKMKKNSTLSICDSYTAQGVEGFGFRYLSNPDLNFFIHMPIPAMTTQAEVLNSGRIQALGEGFSMGDVLTKTIHGIAPTFDPDATYSEGDVVWHYTGQNNVIKLYRFTTSHTGSWITSHVVETTIIDEIKRSSQT